MARTAFVSIAALSVGLRADFDEMPQSAAATARSRLFWRSARKRPQTRGSRGLFGFLLGGTCGGEGNPPFDMLVLMCLFSNATNEIECLPRIAALLPCFPVLLAMAFARRRSGERNVKRKARHFGRAFFLSAHIRKGRVICPEEVATAKLTTTVLFRVSADQTLNIARTGHAVSEEHRIPFRFHWRAEQRLVDLSEAELSSEDQ